MRQLRIVTQITNRDSPSFNKYLQEIDRIDMISPEEEIQLAVLIKQGDQSALEKLAGANLRFVVSVAKQYQHQGLSLNDLVNEGNLGLIKAAQRFDETRGFKFISYAVWWIRQSILQALAEHGRIVRLPSNKIGSYNKAQHASSSFEQEWEREPSPTELAELLGISELEARTVLDGNIKHASLDHPIREEDTTTMGDLLSDGSWADDPVIYDSLKHEIRIVLKSLNRKESDIVRAFFGLDGQESLTTDEIGKKYDLTKERIRQIKQRVVNRLKKTKYSDRLRPYLG